MLPNFLLISLGQNVALLLSLTYLYGLIIHMPRWAKLNRFHILEGFAFGIFGLFAMMTSIEIYPGFFMDGRNIVIILTGTFGGPVAALISGVMVALYRISLGGAGVIPALCALGTAVCTGVGLFYYRRRVPTLNMDFSFLALGLIGGISNLFWPWLVSGPIGLEFARQATLPMVILSPLGTLVLGRLLLHQTHHMKMETALRESEERYHLVVDRMSDGVLVYTPNNRITTYNSSAERILGLSASQLQNFAAPNPNWYTFHEDGRRFTLEEQPILISLQTGQPQTNVVMGIHKPDESITWVNLNTQPLFKQDGSELYGVLVTFSDITESRERQKAFEEERDLLRTLIDHIPDYIFIKDAEGRFVISNAAHNRIAHAQKADELFGKSAFDAFPSELAAQFHADDQAVLQSGKSLVNVERVTVDADGNQRAVLTTKVPLRDSAGTVRGLVGISRDITERKQLEKQSQELSGERERVEILQRFITGMSHDFRTPLSIINTSIYLLGKQTDPVKRQEHFRQLEAQSVHIQHMLDDLLRMSELDRATFNYNFEPIATMSLIQGIVRDFEPIAQAQGLQLIFQADERGTKIRGDVTQLRRALGNLLENAIHYSNPAGTITIRTESSDTALDILVSDNGIGIAEGDKPHIFEYFYRADQARSIDTGGTGLGLSITQKIIEAHGGSIHVDSHVGQGSTFIVTLPLEQPLETYTIS